jgi:hypothetical protein
MGDYRRAVAGGNILCPRIRKLIDQSQEKGNEMADVPEN